MSISFRDPAGRLAIAGGRVVRVVNRSGEADLRAALASEAVGRAVAGGRVVASRLIGEADAARLLDGAGLRTCDEAGPLSVVEHEAVRFPSFPYEWPPEMLAAAAELTLDLADELLPEGLGLKDATPFNVLFRGHAPVLVDFLSFERRDARDPVWLPYAQFVRTFLLPLLVNRHFALPLDQIFLTRRDGLEPEEVYRMCGPVERLRPPFLTLVSIPVRLSSGHDAARTSIYRRRRAASAEQARFILGRQFKSLRRHLKRVAAGARASLWTGYMPDDRHPDENYQREKRAFVEEFLTEFRPRRVLDVGCNTGHFSLAAARGGASVVAVDRDEAAVGAAWRRARREGADVLPLAVDITRPSPATGWRNGECPSFLARARGAFDALLMLAVCHHMLVGERIPLPEILGLAAELTTEFLVVEHVEPGDPMFRRLARGREALFEELTRGRFEEACGRHFRLLRSRQLAGLPRWIYLLQKS
jgi:SAM-dependent methyltransferase